MTRIVLIGMPGAGKTTVGRALAKRLDTPFRDTDRELMARTGVSIATIFEIEGEAGFRRRESLLITQLLNEENLVLATGGGAILDADNRGRMHQSGLVIYLRATVDALIVRTQKDRSRPLLAGNSPRDRLTDLLRVRESLYLETAHMTFDTGRQSPGRLAAAIASAIQTRLPADRGIASP